MTICGKIVISQWEIILALIQKQWRQNRPEIVELFLNLEQSQPHIHHLKNKRGMRLLCGCVSLRWFHFVLAMLSVTQSQTMKTLGRLGKNEFDLRELKARWVAQ